MLSGGGCRDCRVKINDKVTFPMRLNAAKFLELSAAAAAGGGAPAPAAEAAAGGGGGARVHMAAWANTH